MNILLITDLEGVPGVTDIDFVNTENEKYQKAKLYLTECINKTGDFCLKYGAEKVYFFDGHGGPKMNNVIDEITDSRLIKTDADGWQNLAKEGKIDACIELGSHARAGTTGGFLDHTINSRTVFTHKLNGKEQSELSLHAYFLGEYGIPTVGCIGDKAACEQAKEYIPEIYTAVVKTAKARNFCTDTENPYEAIEDMVRNIFKGERNIEPLKISKPITVEITYYRTDMCEGTLERTSDVERVDARTLRKISNTLESFTDLKI